MTAPGRVVHSPGRGAVIARREPLASGYAFSRLVWWPAGVALVLAFVCLGAFPWLLAMDVPSPFASARAVWRSTLIAAGIVGLSASVVGAQLVGQPFGRMLPAARQRVARGVAAVGVLVSLALALIQWRIGSPFASAETVFGMAMLTYVVVAADMLPPIPRMVRRGAAVVLALVLFQPSIVIAVGGGPEARTASVVAVILGCVIAMYALSPMRSVGTTDLRLAGGSPVIRIRLFPWAGEREISFRSGPLVAAGVRGWLRAVWYERGWGGAPKAGGLGFLIQAGIWPLMVVATGNRNMLVYGLCQALAFQPPPLYGGFAYPVSRATRVRLDLVDTVLRSASYCAIAAIVYSLLYSPLAPFRARWGVDDMRPGVDLVFGPHLILILTAAFAVAPLTLWPASRGWFFSARTQPSLFYQPLAKGSPARAYALGFLLLMVVSFVGSALAFAGFALGPTREALAIADIACLTYFIYWRALRRYFAKVDLQ